MTQYTNYLYIHTCVHIQCDVEVYIYNKLIKGKALRKHSLHEKTAASVLLKLFIGYQTCIIYLCHAERCACMCIWCQNNKRLILGCSPPLWDNRPDSLIMAWGPEARRALLGWKADYLIMAASNQVINVFNTNALQNHIPVDPNVLSLFHVVVVGFSQ